PAWLRSARRSEPRSRSRSTWICYTTSTMEVTMRRIMVFAIAVCVSALLPAQNKSARTLEIYVIDVEGGNGVLFVSPTHESLLMDTGNAGAIPSARDSGRIMDAIKDAGLTQIDHLITTHWHGDHFGGEAELASKIPIKEFIDHGPNTQP